jgi:hypothetical protein
MEMIDKIVVITEILICFCLIGGCEEERGFGECPMYTHIVEDELHFRVEYDSISLFIFATEYYDAPISYTHQIDNQLADSLIIEIHAYGRSYKSKPDIHDGHVWYSDSLVVWYSGDRFREYLIEHHFGSIRMTPPCPMTNEYKIDYIHLRHSDDLIVDVDSMVWCSLTR